MVEKRVVFLTCLFVLMAFTSYAETIYTNDGKVINARILNVTKNTIWYEVPDGSLGINKSMVSKICNDDGTISEYSPTYIKPEPQIEKIPEILPKETKAIDEAQQHEQAEQVKPDAAFLYNKAKNSLAPIPDNLKESINDIIKNGWQENAQLRNLIAKNNETMQLFKMATKGENPGYLFGEKPDLILPTIPLPQFKVEMDIVRLLLLEVRIKQADKLTSSIAESYIAIVGFMQHLAAQEYGCVMSSLLQTLCMKMALPALTQSINDKDLNTDSCKDMLKNMLYLKNKQDFLKRGIEEESESMKNSAVMLKQEVESGTTVAENMQVGDVISKETLIALSKAERKNVEYNKFFKRLSVVINRNVDILKMIALDGAKTNNIKMYEEKEKNYLYTIEQRVKGRGGETWAKIIKGEFDATEEYADRIADILSSVATPAWPKIITRYHVFYNRLNTVITSIAVKLYMLENGKLPDNLEALVPKYLEVIPEDTFNEFKPLHYHTDGSSFTVYSFGPNRTDDGGNVIFDEYQSFSEPFDDSGDIVFIYNEI